MASRLASAAKTDVGLKRTNNEDNYAIVQSAGLYVLADGMGGHASGQVASTMCVSHIAQYICETARQPGFKLSFPIKPNLSYEANLLANAIMYANERVFIQSCKDRSMEGMGTTVTAIYNAPNNLVLAHVGDSRIYRVRKGEIKQMSRDHSLLNHLIDKGELKPEDAPNFANKNVILRAIGLKDEVEVDVQEVPRETGDIYMMCSDGLSDLVPDNLICQTITKAPTLPDACTELIGLALKAGGKDNVTVVCVAVEDADDAAKIAPPMTPGMMHPAPSLGAVRAVPVNIPPVAVPHPSMPMMEATAKPSIRMMAPIPVATPVQPQPPQSPQPAQPPQRMHSVREIVEVKEVIEVRSPSRAMPKPIGSAGRAPLDTPAPAIDNPDSDETKIISSPPQSVVKQAASDALKKIPAPGTHAPSDDILPQAELLFTAPPAPPSQTEKSQDERFSEDDSKTMSECPIITDEILKNTSVPPMDPSLYDDEDDDLDDSPTLISNKSLIHASLHALSKSPATPPSSGPNFGSHVSFTPPSQPKPQNPGPTAGPKHASPSRPHPNFPEDDEDSIEIDESLLCPPPSSRGPHKW